jgi:hypothetical protein
METLKVAALGVAIAVAAVPGIIAVSKEQPPVQAASGKAVDTMAAHVLQVAKGDTPVVCCRERVGTADGIVLEFACPGTSLTVGDQAEMSKLAEADTRCIRFPTRPEGNVTVLDHELIAGVLPNLDPVPVEAVPEKPAEGLGSNSIPVEKP